MTNLDQPTSVPTPDDPAEREMMRGLYRLFDKMALEDQQNFYLFKSRRYHQASMQVNRLRAGFSLLTGIASALAGLLVSRNFDANGQCLPDVVSNCRTVQVAILICTITSFVFPAIAAGLNTVSDLFQWNRLITIYDSALENLNVADALSPVEEMGNEEYRASLAAYAAGTLNVMSDETAQWGQLKSTPQATDNFLKREQSIAARASRSPTANGDVTT